MIIGISTFRVGNYIFSVIIVLALLGVVIIAAGAQYCWDLGKIKTDQ